MDTKISAALVQEAAKAGMVDMDAIKLIDTKNLTLDHAGRPVGVQKAVANLKAAHPLMFEKPFDARTATPEELAAEAKKRGLHIKKY